MWGGQGYPNKHHEHFKVIFSITREEIQLPVKIGDKNLNLTQPIGQPVIEISITEINPRGVGLLGHFGERNITGQF